LSFPATAAPYKPRYCAGEPDQGFCTLQKPVDRKRDFQVKIQVQKFPSKILPRRWGKVYLSTMTKLLEHAVDTARTLPPAMQDDVARLLLQFLGEEQPVIQLTPEEVASFAESRAQASRREFATDEQVRAVWAKHGL
jgi:hypothetical protein